MRFSYYDRSRGCGCAFSCIPTSVIILITSCFSCLKGCSGSGTEAWSALPCPSLSTVFHLSSLCLLSWWKHTWTLTRASCLLLPGCSLRNYPHFSAWNFKGRKISFHQNFMICDRELGQNQCCWTGDSVPTPVLCWGVITEVEKRKILAINTFLQKLIDIIIIIIICVCIGNIRFLKCWTIWQLLEKLQFCEME